MYEKLDNVKCIRTKGSGKKEKIYIILKINESVICERNKMKSECVVDTQPKNRNKKTNI